MDPAGRPSKSSNRKLSRSSKTDTLNSDTVPKTSCESTVNRVFQVDLKKLCPKKFFYVFLVAESDERSAPFLEKLAEISKHYEEVSCLTFITREDVLRFFNSDCNNADFIFPSQLKPLLLSVIESFDFKTDLPAVLESQLVKLKLVEVMYRQYVDEVKSREKERELEDLLGTLTKECRKKIKKDEGDEGKNKSPVKDVSKKNKKDDSNPVKESDNNDFITLDRDEISYEENIYDYVWFYCLKGFSDIQLLENLITQTNLPIDGVVKVCSSEVGHSSTQIKTFWKEIENKFYNNTSFENTTLLHFSSSQVNDDFKSILEDFINILRDTINLKLTYLNYLRHLKVNKVQNSYTTVNDVECLKLYTKYLKGIPIECVTPQLILEGVLKEVDCNLDSNCSSVESFSNKSTSFKSLHCIDPLHDFDSFSSKSSVENHISKRDKLTYLIHESNFLEHVFKSYGHSVGPKVAGVTLRLLKDNFVFLNKLQSSEFPENVTHFHDLNPSKESLKPDYRVDNFMYILLFHKIFKKTYISELSRPVISLYPYLDTFSVKQLCRNCLEFSNDYDTSIVHFRWKENLSKDVLLQQVDAASKEFGYSYVEYSPETDNILVVFSDRLDAFGLNVKTYDVLLRSPVCFRDFCRYNVVKDSSWLQENQVKVRADSYKMVFDEVCPGAHKVKTQFRMFEEYSYLLDVGIKEDESLTEDCEEADGGEGVKFTDLLEDLQKCPKSHFEVLEECKDPGYDKELLAYDVGSTAFKIIGGVTTFCSHDNVKITVDNSRLLEQPEKCTIKITSGGNMLVVNSSENLTKHSNISMLHLTDATRISLILSHQEDSTNTNSEEEIDVVNSPPSLPEVNELNDMDEPLVHCVNEDFIRTLLPEGQSLEDLSFNEDCEDLIDSILAAKECNGTIYKVNAKTNYIKRKKDDLKIPLENALRNILSARNLVLKQPKTYEVFTKKFKPLRGRIKDINNSVDFRVCLPNGLYIRPHFGIEDVLMIKQEYADNKPEVTSVQHEEFRLFSSKGFVLTKKIDGSIKIFKYNGDVIDLEKPTDDPVNNSSIKPCHCITFEDYRNKLNKLLKDLETCDYSISRRGHITSKQNHIMDAKMLRILQEFDVPYLKKSMVRFDGKRIKIQGDKISQKQLCHLVSLQDFNTGDVTYERSDNFRSVFCQTGFQIVTFPDGTVITSCVDVSEDLVDDFVWVTLSFEYQHPYYVNVEFDFEKKSKIKLNNGVVIGQNGNSFYVDMEQGFSVSTSQDNIRAYKSCDDCSGRFEAVFDTSNFNNTRWEPLKVFLKVKDSYQKEFSADFVGNCTWNDSYVKGATNSVQCNHLHKNQYRKLFLINRDLSGYQFLTNDFIKNHTKQVQSEPNGVVETYSLLTNGDVTTVDCRRKFFRRFSERFFNHTHEQEFYTTFRTFQKMFDSVEDIVSQVADLQVAGRFDDLTSLADDLEEYCYKYQHEIVSELRMSREIKTKQLQELRKRQKHQMTTCDCGQKQMTIQEKMLKWRQECQEYRQKIRRRNIPGYFKSQFCKVVQ